MQFKKGVDVVDKNGKKVGSMERVVIDPRTGEVTDLIIHKGHLLIQDKVLPVDQVQRTGDNEVILNTDADNLKDLPDYIEARYVPMDKQDLAEQQSDAEAAIPMLWYPAPGQAMFSYPGLYPDPTQYPNKIELKENTPKGTVALQEGARVIGKDGKHVGNVEKVITEDQKSQVTHLLITKGTFNHEMKLIPANWISGIKDDGVRLSVSADFVDRLAKYSE
jgi:uncharacterized protein YrrD